MYLETMEKVLADIDKVIIDKDQDLVSFLVHRYQSLKNLEVLINESR